ncbi:hypothetical protein CBR_g31462 [Chara braunii]|uniref:Uncharacterized protein n=1 Tax=Chara braunii TaxID=69332 RepID=A0A388LF25_CHABU|nr:hypothetical protein CBR_g31462 [Chara braunii]|eukprot:GBG80906.1 hypothetical protein CBR_g31462 [Chara braunii]
MSSHDGNRSKKRDNCEGDTAVAVKKGRHVARNEKALAEGPWRGSAAMEEEWVRDFDAADEDKDFVTDTEVGGNRSKKRDNCEGDTTVAVKKGWHVARNKKALAEGPSRGSAAREEEWVRDFDAADEDKDFVTDTEVGVVKEASVRAQEALWIDDTRPCALPPQPCAGEGVRKPDVIIDMDAAQAMRQVQAKATPKTARAGGTIARTRVTVPPDTQDCEQVQSPPTTPRARIVPGAGGAANVAVQGGVHGAAGAVEGAKDSLGDGDDDEPLVNRQRWGNARDGIEAATKLWVDDIKSWNETEGNGLFKLVQEARLYLLAIDRGIPTPDIRRSIALPQASIPQDKIDDGS